MYEALTLRLPYPGQTSEVYYRMMSRQLPASIRRSNPAVPAALEGIVLRCLEHDPRRRYGTAAELKEDLERYVRQQPVAARVPTRLGRAVRYVGLNKARLAIAAVSFAVLLAGLLASAMVVARDANETRRYHTYLAGQVDRQFERELQATLSRGLAAATSVSERGASRRTVLENMRGMPPSFASADLIDVSALNGLSLIIVEGAPLVFKLADDTHPRQCFVGLLLRDSTGRVSGACGWWMDPKRFVAERLQTVVDDRLKAALNDEVYSIQENAADLSVAVFDPLGQEIRRLRIPRKTSSVGTASMKEPFKNFRVQVASAR